MRIKPAAVALAAVALSGCGATSHSFAFKNDLPDAVIVEGCADCGVGHVVRPGETHQYEIAEEVVIKVTRSGGTVLGCAYIPKGASASERMEQSASDFEGLTCDGKRPISG
jgi:hypothetical protein